MVSTCAAVIGPNRNSQAGRIQREVFDADIVEVDSKPMTVTARIAGSQ